MEPIEVKKNVYWVGSVDWGIRNFHGYSTHRGTTYNAFLVLDEKNVLFDTVKSEFREDLLRKIRQVIDPAKIDYIVVSHVEMDHSGSLPQVADIVQPEKIFCSPRGEQALHRHFSRNGLDYEVVKTGDTRSIGRRTIQFIESRMLHWPDSMCSYIGEDRLLISNDIFGQHWATSERFDDEVDLSELLGHAAKYYANIIMPYSPIVAKFLKQIQDMNLDIDMIATDHGLIWRSHIPEIIDAYSRWSRQETKEKALVVFDSMWHSTERMAEAVADGLMLEDISVKVLDLKANARDDVMTEALDARGILLGSSTLHNGILPKVADMVSYMKGLKPKGRVGAAFGSYGWSGESVKLLNEALDDMKIERIDPGVSIQYVPTEEDLQKCVELGRNVGKAIKENKQE